MINSDLLDQEGQEQRASDAHSVCGALQREANWKCLILTLLIATCLSAITWCRLTEITRISSMRSTVRRPSLCSSVCPPVIINFSVYPVKNTRQMSPCDDGYIYIPVAFMAMLYLVYLVECWHSTARIQLSYRADISGVMERVQQMRDANPIVWWKVVCYHYVRRKRQVTRYRHGDAYTTSQVYYERVNSHAAAARFHYTYCGVRDISKILTLDIRGPITKIRFSKGFAFANVEAATEFEEQRSRFFAEHECYDDYMEMREGMDLTSFATFKEFVVAYADPHHRPWYSGTRVFWLASCLLLSWPLRMLLEYNTAHVHYQVTKLFGVNYQTAPPPPVSHVTTVDSDLEGRILGNQALVPSYSEALLMEELHPDPVSVDVDSRAVLLDASDEDEDDADVAHTALARSATQHTMRVSPSLATVRRSDTHHALFYPSPLVDHCPGDPFRGRDVTTPTEDPPPPYEDALRLPVLARLRRSLTARGDIGGSRRVRTNIHMETSL